MTENTSGFAERLARESLRVHNRGCLDAHAATSRPVLLLDIDGVLSPLGATHGLTSYGRSVQRAQWRVRDQVAEELRALNQVCAIVWASGWEEESFVLGSELGLRADGFLDSEASFAGRSLWFKEDAVLDYLRENTHRKIIYAEDEIPTGFADICRRVHSDILVLDVDGQVGLASEDFSTIRKFLDCGD